MRFREPPTLAAYSAARVIVAPVTAGSSVASATCTAGITRTCPGVTGPSGTIASASFQRATTVAGAAPATMRQNTQVEHFDMRNLP
ncbi:hypothetical protein GKJPGBOP_05465 [Streptomyces paromomycinus]|uniref:Secreted protein n=1 Tax=Streptomyces paromomycinus TaxID=92743 RepID=A0A401W8T2_STREY|nr:hypothetical protein GKJPGBOP_05465 [Streptomyces paromomycinus]